MRDEEKRLCFIPHPSSFIHPLRCFSDLAGLDTGGANFHALGSALWELDAYGLQVRIKTARRAIISVRDIIAELRAFAANFTSFSHDFRVPPGYCMNC
jgi:hypothetical protein